MKYYTLCVVRREKKFVKEQKKVKGQLLTKNVVIDI